MQNTIEGLRLRKRYLVREVVAAIEAEAETW
jgi:hypothetical protein